MTMEYELMKSIMVFSFVAVLCVPVLVAQIDRSKAPAPQPTPSISLPKIQRTALANGATLIAVEHHELPIVRVRLILKSGSSLDPSGKAGVASLTAQMVREGTEKRTSLQIDDEFDFLGANFFITSSGDATTASLQTLKEPLDRSLDVFADVLSHPSFPSAEWTRVQQQHLTGLLQQKDRPTTVANNVFAALLYGSGHPYGRPEDGTDRTVQSILLDDVRDFYARNYVSLNATTIVVGDIALAEIQSALDKHFADWKSATAPGARYSNSPAIDGTKIFLVDKPKRLNRLNRKSASVILAHRAIAATTMPWRS